MEKHKPPSLQYYNLNKSISNAINWSGNQVNYDAHCFMKTVRTMEKYGE